ncbi:MAG: hypothetical protein HWE30_04845 [Methylocystaceae bacterium]|nr:hypothetical protein [Methylocystaceae bacterium]
MKLISFKSLICFIFIVFSYSGFFSYRLAEAGHQQIILNHEPQNDPTEACRVDVYVFGRDGRHFAEVFKSYIHMLNNKIEEEESTITPAHWQRLEQLLCNADQRLSERQELVSGVRALMARGDYLYRYRTQTQQHPVLYKRMIEGWQQNLDEVMALAPKRFDLAIPFYNWLLETGQEEDLYQRAQKALQYKSTKPIGLWFSGIVLLNDPARKDRGVVMLKEALDFGIEKFFPVEAGLKQALNNL